MRETDVDRPLFSTPHVPVLAHVTSHVALHLLNRRHKQLEVECQLVAGIFFIFNRLASLLNPSTRAIPSATPQGGVLCGHVAEQSLLTVCEKPFNRGHPPSPRSEKLKLSSYRLDCSGGTLCRRVIVVLL